MAINFSFCNDKAQVSSLPINVSDEIRRLELVSETAEHQVSFCGMLSTKGTISIFMPRSVNLDEASIEKKISSASELMRAIEIYGRQSKTRVVSQNEGEGRSGLTQLSIVRELLNFYRSNGLYSQRKSVRVQNSGKPDWRRTVSTSTPFPDNESRPVYLDIQGSKRRYISDCEVARIHAEVIRDLDETYSWITTGKRGLLAPELLAFQKPNGDSGRFLSVLRAELAVVYSDDDVRLIKLLIAYIKNKSGEDVTGNVIGLKKFHFAWEHMLSHVLDNKIKINEKLPAPSYKELEVGFSDAFSKSMKTDITLKNPFTNELAVVDAKYYSAQDTANVPGWADMVKQFFYEKAIKAVMPSFKLRNAFVFPGDGGPFISVHMKSKEDGRLFDNEFPPIYCHYAKPQEVIYCYVNRSKMQVLSNQLLGS